MTELSNLLWGRIRDRLASMYGLYIDDSRVSQGHMAVLHRARLLGLGPASYTELIHTPAGDRELRSLAEQLANHETQFLRNPAHFRALREHILPALHHMRPPSHALRCWSAGCSSGEEAYGIAMAALNVFGSPPVRDVQVWGTDLSAPVIERARRGEYKGRTLTNVQDDYRRWLEPLDDGTFRVSANVRSLVQFEQHNLLDKFPGWARQLDIVFCQNVTIYFQLATCQQLIERLYEVMAEGSYLLLGFSETLWGIFDRFETVELDGAFVYRKGPQRITEPIRRPVVMPQRVMAPAPKPITPPVMPRPPRRQTTTQPAVDSAELIKEINRLRNAGAQRAALTLIFSQPASVQTPAILALTALLHADLGEWDQAAREARRSLELDVMQQPAYLVLGMLDVQRGAYQEALKPLERALYLAPDVPIVSFYLAECYRHLGRIDAALREYRNTRRKLGNAAPTELVDGVAAGWLQTTCGSWIEVLEKQERG